MEASGGMVKNPAICPGEEPSFCTCGARLTEAPAPKKVDTRTGKPVYSRREVCPRRRWWRFWHDSFLVTAGGIWLDEQYL